MSGKISQFVAKTKKVYGDVFFKYPVTMILVIFSTIYACVFEILVEHNVGEKFNEDALAWWMLLAVYITVGAFGIENLPKRFLEKSTYLKKTVGLVIVAFISGTLLTLTSANLFGTIELESLKDIPGNSTLAWNMAYFVVIFLWVLRNRYKESGYSAEKYFVSVFSQNIQLGIAWGILALGILILTLIFDELIISPDFSGYFVPQVLIFGLYVVPCMMMNVTDVKEEIGKFFENLIKYVLLILTIIGAAIIYIYIVKTIITGIPSNEIFAIASALFFVAIPVGFACTAFEKDTLLQKIAYILPYIYAPFIILQIYSIFVRIEEYGVTQSRYMGVVLIVLEILYTIVYALGRKHIDKLLLIMMAITVVITLVPGINVNAASRRSQMKCFAEFIENGLPDSKEECARITGAYYYLRSEYGTDYVNDMLTNEQIDELESLDVNVMHHESLSCYMHSDESSINIRGFDTLTRFNVVFYSGDNFSPDSVTIDVDGAIFGTYDLSNEFDTVERMCEEAGKSRVEGILTVDISDECQMVITMLDFIKDVYEDEYRHVQLIGYLLYTDSYYM